MDGKKNQLQIFYLKEIEKYIYISELLNKKNKI